MPIIEIADFGGGINDRQAPHLIAPNEAVSALDCVIQSGAIVPLNAPSTVQAVTAGTVSIHKFNGTWQTSTSDRWYTEDGSKLYWADGGIPQKKNTSGTQVRLGIAAPSSGSASLNYLTGIPSTPPTSFTQESDVSYCLTFYSSTWGGESAPYQISAGAVAREPLYEDIDAVTTTVKLGPHLSLNGIASAPGVIRLGDELISYTGASDTLISGIAYYTTLTGVTRGAFGTTKAAHTKGGYAKLIPTNATVTIPTTSSDPQVTHVRIYRLAAGEYQLVSETALGTASVTDTTTDGNLGAILTSDNNDLPPNLTGITIYNGMLVGWLGKSVYVAEVGKPDAWVAQYDFKSTVAACIVYGGFVAVLTAEGPYTLSGTAPDALAQFRAQSAEGCKFGRTAVTMPQGVLYVSNSGVCLFDGVRTEIVSAAKLRPDWFPGMINPRSAFHDGFYYLFYEGINADGALYSAGGFIGDFRRGAPIWTTTSQSAAALHRSDVDQALYLVQSTSLKQWGGGSALSWSYRSATFAPSQMARIHAFHAMRINCSGSVTPRVDVNGITFTLTAQSGTQKTVRLRMPGPKRGHRVSVSLLGSGTVYSAGIEYD